MMVVIGWESVEVGEFGALNFDEYYVQQDHRRNERYPHYQARRSGQSLKAASNIQAFGVRMMGLIALVVL
jgi:hypothetical protein